MLLIMIREIKNFKQQMDLEVNLIKTLPSNIKAIQSLQALFMINI